MARSIWNGTITFGLIESLYKRFRPSAFNDDYRDRVAELIERGHQIVGRLGRFVMRAKEYLAIVRAHDRALMLSTMLFADEVRPTDDIEAAKQKAHKPSAPQLPDLMAALERTLAEMRGSGKRQRQEA
jgi:non-homologous end joining protein Ku